MTQEAFIKELERKGYSYKIVGDKIVVTHKGDVWLSPLTSLPPRVEFKNGKDVYLDSLKTLPPGVEFRNGGHANLRELTSLSVGVEFNNGGSVFFESLINVGFISRWQGNIDGIEPKRLLNKMIELGLFDKGR